MRSSSVALFDYGCQVRIKYCGFSIIWFGHGANFILKKNDFWKIILESIESPKNSQFNGFWKMCVHVYDYSSLKYLFWYKDIIVYLFCSWRMILDWMLLLF